jgi:hypothetical protein
MTGEVMEFKQPVICALTSCREEIVGDAYQFQGIDGLDHVHPDCRVEYLFQQEMQGNRDCEESSRRVVIKYTEE